MYTNILRGSVKRMGPDCLFSAAQWQDKRQWAWTETCEVPSENEETLLYYVGDGALEQVVQGACGISFIEDIQN